MIDTALASGAPQLNGITRQRLERESQIRLNVHGDASDDKPWLPFANGFDTPSRKALLYNADLIQHGMDPVARFVPPGQNRGTGSIPCWMRSALYSKALRLGVSKPLANGPPRLVIAGMAVNVEPYLQFALQPLHVMPLDLRSSRRQRGVDHRIHRLAEAVVFKSHPQSL